DVPVDHIRPNVLPVHLPAAGVGPPAQRRRRRPAQQIEPLLGREPGLAAADGGEEAGIEGVKLGPLRRGLIERHGVPRGFGRVWWVPGLWSGPVSVVSGICETTIAAPAGRRGPDNRRP